MELTRQRLDELIAAEEAASIAVREARRILVPIEHQHRVAQLELMNYRRRWEMAEFTRISVEAEQRRVRV